MKLHGDNPENKGESDNSQKIHIEGHVAAVPGGIPGNVGKIGKG